ncbi:MAG: helix-turn-helix transcriptional regulator, partial [Bacteriovoracaceae bacterium]|nr:helix-turn-helix transcriptional regulator [Bacteriovoracaceae bacterium]
MKGPRVSSGIRKQQILAAAKRCFQRKGYAQTTIDEIAAEYGMSKGSIY